jgi:hypothetical protein
VLGSLGYRFLPSDLQKSLELLKRVRAHAWVCRVFFALEKADECFRKGDWSLLNWQIKVNARLLMFVTPSPKKTRKEGMLKALMFDVDGNYASTESVPLAAFNQRAHTAQLSCGTLGLDGRMHIATIADTSQTPINKPDPQDDWQTVRAKQSRATKCIAFKDSSTGLQASCAVGLATVVTPTRYCADRHFTYSMRLVTHMNSFPRVRLSARHAAYLH